MVFILSDDQIDHSEW